MKTLLNYFTQKRKDANFFITCFCFCVIIFLLSSCKTQKQSISLQEKEVEGYTVRTGYRFMFYNCENFFDANNDSLSTGDDDFTPEGNYHWTWYKFVQKANQIAKVIIAAGNWNPPEVIGFCEIENQNVLDYLVNKTPLAPFKYRIIHKESPDSRGIDVAAIYRDEFINPIDLDFIRIVDSNDSTFTTRDILYFKFSTKKADTVNFFVNHFPSRLGGNISSQDSRCLVASKLKYCVDTILKRNENSNIVICGDFNDYPTDSSINKVLGTKLEYENIQNKSLYNLAYFYSKNQDIGSHKFESDWGMLDQFIVSGNLLQRNSLYTRKEYFRVFNADFLLERDEKFLGVKTKRTHIGMQYNAGFSDHLPVLLDFED